MDDTNLHALLARLSPRRLPGEYVFAVADETIHPVPDDAIVASVHEAEGRSLVLARQDADRAGLPYDYVAAWITLDVRSELHAIGLTAAVASALGDAGISCNVIAGFHHDHLLVPHDRADEALAALQGLTAHEFPGRTGGIRP